MEEAITYYDVEKVKREQVNTFQMHPKKNGVTGLKMNNSLHKKAFNSPTFKILHTSFFTSLLFQKSSGISFSEWGIILAYILVYTVTWPSLKLCVSVCPWLLETEKTKDLAHILAPHFYVSLSRLYFHFHFDCTEARYNLSDCFEMSFHWQFLLFAW